MASDARSDAGSRVVRIYTRWAFVYDAWTALFETRSLEAALERSDLRDGGSADVLEIAVGTGVLFRQILRANPRGRNVGVDLTEAMLKRARAKARGAGARFELLRADARALPFDDATFDVVLANNMLGLLPEETSAPILGEALRVLRPGGRFVTVMMRRPTGGLPLAAFRLLPAWFGGWRDVDVGPFLRAAGFVSIERDVVRQLGIASDVILARKPAAT